MKAISIRQPWAWLILNAGKDIENRTWRTNFRGKVAIHASKGMARDEYLIARAFAYNTGLRIALPEPEDLVRGAIVGTVEIVDCVSDSDSPWFTGPHGFVLRNPIKLPHWACKGALGFFDFNGGAK